jgi:hypothetical protein
MEGKAFGDVPLTVDLKLEVHDSPNSAGIVIDAVRCCKLGLDRGLGGALEGPASYFMKSPPFQVSDESAHELTEAFIAGRVAAACISDPEETVAPRQVNLGGNGLATGAPQRDATPVGSES